MGEWFGSEVERPPIQPEPSRPGHALGWMFYISLSMTVYDRRRPWHVLRWVFCISLSTTVCSSVRSVRGMSDHALQLRWQSRQGDVGRREASRMVGIRWIDGLWPKFCPVNWESVVGLMALAVGSGSSLKGRPCPTQRLRCGRADVFHGVRSWS
jgi:hypothetical protein